MFECEQLITPDFRMSILILDNVFGINQNIFIIKAIFCLDGVYRCTVTPFKYVHDLYEEPLPSSKIGIYFVKNYQPSQVISVSEISTKYACFPFHEGFAVFPIINL